MVIVLSDMQRCYYRHCKCVRHRDTMYQKLGNYYCGEECFLKERDAVMNPHDPA